MNRARRKADLALSLKLSIAEGIASMPICTISLPVNVLLVALVTKAIPLSPGDIGLFSALPFLANFLHIFVMPALSRWRPPKMVSVVTATIHWATWIALGIFLPAIARLPAAAASRWLIAWFLFSSVFIAIAGVAWNSWIQEWVPERVRGKFFGGRNRLTQLSATVFLLAAGWVIGRWDYAIPAFQVLLGTAVVGRVFSLYWQWISPTHPLRPAPAHQPPFRSQLRCLLRSPSLLAFVAFGCVWSFATNCFGAFYPVFMFQQLHFSAFAVGLTSTLSQLGGALSLPAWGRLLDRYGNKPVMIVSLVLWQGSNLFWCFCTPHNAHVLYAIWLFGGATSAGFILGQFTILLRVIPFEAKDLAIAFNLAVTSLFAAAAPILGGAFLDSALPRGNAFTIYHECFLVQPVLALGGAFLLFRVAEPAAAPLGIVVGAMRNIRTLGAVIGLEFLTNYLFPSPNKGRSGR